MQLSGIENDEASGIEQSMMNGKANKVLE